MKWKRVDRGSIDDRRGETPRGLGGGGLPIGPGMGIPGLIVLLVVLFLGGRSVLGGDGSGGGFGMPDIELGAQPPATTAVNAPQAEEDLVDFMAFVFQDVETSWQEVFANAQRTYRASRLNIFRNAVDTACGTASSQTGPFYCPADQEVYLDLGFFRELTQRFNAPGDFAQAYVIAHELGHHVQNQLGVAERVNELSREDPGRANELSVRQELQADCFAGVWAHSTYERGILETGDIEEGLRAAQAIGDDRIQEQAGVRVDRETWTHGSAEQRSRWLRRGFDSGNPDDCDTFAGDI